MMKLSVLSPRQKKIAIIISTIVLAYLIFGFFVAPFIVRRVLENRVAEAIGRQVAVGSVRINPITLSVTLKNLAVRESGGSPFVQLDEAYANLQTASLFKWALVLKSVRLVNPRIFLVRSAETTFNFSDIGKDNTAAVEKPTDSGGFALAIHSTRITGARISLDDRVVSVSHRIDDLNLTVSDFSSRPSDAEVSTFFNLAARINGATFSLKGHSRPFCPDRYTLADLGVEGLNVPHYLPYVTLPENLKVRSLGLATKTEIEFRMLAGDKPELVVAGLLSLSDARLTDGKGEPFVYHPHLTFDLLPSRVLAGQLRLARVDTTKSEYFIKRLASGKLYLPFLAVKAFEEAETKAAADTSGEFKPLVTIDSLILKQGVVHFTDLSNVEPFSTTITDLELTLNNFGINSNRTAAYRLSLKTEADETVNLSGTASFTPLAAAGEIEVATVKLNRYRPYYQDLFDFKTAAGQVSFGGNYRFRQQADAPLVTLAGVHVDVAALKVVEENDDEPLLSLERLNVTDTTADLTRREVTLGAVELFDAQLFCRREQDGTLNLTQAFVPSPDAHPPGAQAVGISDRKKAQAAEPEAAPLVMNLKKVRISDATVELKDHVPAEPVSLRLDEINLTATDVSTAAGATGKADLSLRWEREGQLHVKGDVTIEPLALDMALKMGNVDIRPFQPYLSEQTGLIVTEGFFNTQGRLALSMKQEGAPAITYRGQAGLNRFASIDTKNANDFLKWEGLLFEDIEVGVNPDRLYIDQIALNDFFARVIVDTDGSLNLVSILKPTQETPATEKAGSGGAGPAVENSAAATAPNPETPPVRIARVILSGGDVDFSDRFIKPNFNARFHDLGGRVSGLESIAEKRADVLLEGMWAKHAPVKITGRINPLIENPYLDLNLNISDIELSPFSPYSGKYIGYILEKGKLTFNVDYLMQNNKLEGKNGIFINQLTLGDTVDSPDAVDLPVKLAVALLKDRQGNIELDLPVSGSLDDPQFKFGKVLLAVFKNLIVKIVSSPFAALGALAGGGGEELSYLEFDAGVGTISQENAQKMDKLTKILYERPALNLDIQGVAAPQADSDALRAILLENRLKAQKLQQMMKAGKSAVPLEAITLSEEERPVLVETVFAASGIAVPLDSGGKPVELTPPEMEKLLRTHIALTENDYRKLANSRAFNAKNYLHTNGKVERERMFIVAPRIAAKDQEQPDSANGQVVFSLK